jgi:hypothetical protein
VNPREIKIPFTGEFMSGYGLVESKIDTVLS